MFYVNKKIIFFQKQFSNYKSDGYMFIFIYVYYILNLFVDVMCQVDIFNKYYYVYFFGW